MHRAEQSGCQEQRATAFRERFFACARRRSAGISFGFAENRSSFAACAAKPHSLHCLR